MLSFPCNWFYRTSSEVGWTQVRTHFYHFRVWPSPCFHVSDFSVFSVKRISVGAKDMHSTVLVASNRAL